MRRFRKIFQAIGERVFRLGIFREMKIWWGENRVGVAKMLVVFVWIFGILMRLGVAVGVKMPVWNYDMGGPDGYGHMGYMWRIYKTGRLPQWNYQQFYHPPLHYLIGAGVLKVSSIFTNDEELMQNLLKVMSFCWSILILIVVWRFLGEIELRRRTKYLAMTVFLCQTGLIRMACSVNNDPLSILLIFYSLLWLIRWWKKPSIKGAGILGIFTGLAVMTKTSAMVLWPVEFIVFIVKMISSVKSNRTFLLERKESQRKERKDSSGFITESQKSDKKIEKQDLGFITSTFIKMAVAFMIISLPIGLWYPVRNYVRFGQEFGYVLDLGDPEKNVVEKPLYGPERGLQTKIEEDLSRAALYRIKTYENTLEHSVTERLVPPGLEQLVVGRKRKDSSRDYYNLYASIILTSLYEDLGIDEDAHGEAMVSALSVIIMVWASVVVVGVIARACLRIVRVIRKKKLDFEIVVEMMMIIYSVVLIAGYVMMNLRLPIGCSTSFRYIMPLVMTGVSVMEMEEKKSGKRGYRGVIYIGLALMIFAYGLADLVIMAG